MSRWMYIRLSTCLKVGIGNEELPELMNLRKYPVRESICSLMICDNICDVHAHVRSTIRMKENNTEKKFTYGTVAWCNRISLTYIYLIVFQRLVSLLDRVIISRTFFIQAFKVFATLQNSQCKLCCFLHIYSLF